MTVDKVLVVDDSLTARLLVMQCLKIAEAREFTFFEAADGEEALKILAAEPIELILTDVIMPGMPGTELVVKVRAMDRYRSTPVLIFTSLDQNAIHMVEKDLENVLIIQKPITPERLAIAIKALK